MELGYDPSQISRIFPSAQTIIDAVSAEETDFLTDRQKSRVDDRLLISPTVRNIGLTSTDGLLARFDTMQPTDKPAVVQGDTWGRTHDFAAVHDNNVGWPNFQAGVLLGDKADQDFLEPGLVFLNHNVDEQRKLFEAEREQLAQKCLTIRPVTIGQLVVANAQLRIEGDSWLDSQVTATRFIQYQTELSPMALPPPSINTAHSRGERLWLVGSLAGVPKPNEGVRRVLHLAVVDSEEIREDEAKRLASPGLIPGIDLSKKRTS